MGTDFNCGCRNSMGRWFLCEKHEIQLMNILAKYELINNDI